MNDQPEWSFPDDFAKRVIAQATAVKQQRFRTRVALSSVAVLALGLLLTMRLGLHNTGVPSTLETEQIAWLDDATLLDEGPAQDVLPEFAALNEDNGNDNSTDGGELFALAEVDSNELLDF